MSRRFLLFPVALVAPFSSGAEDPSSAKLEALFKGGDPAAFLEAAHPLAERGNGKALFLLGQMYARPSKESPITQDADKAGHFFLRAFEAGYGPEALDEAVAWLVVAALEARPRSAGALPAAFLNLRNEILRLGEKAKVLQRAGAIHNMGAFYVNSGEPKVGLPWLRQAADLKHPMALEMLAWLYETGKGEPGDEKMAMALHEQAAALGEKTACAKVRIAWRTRVQDAGFDLDRLTGVSGPLKTSAAALPKGLLDDLIRDVDDHAAVAREIRDNAHRAVSLPQEPLRMKLCLGNGLQGQGWQVEVCSPGFPDIFSTRKEDHLAEGTFSADGCAIVGSAGETKIRAALERGQSMAFWWWEGGRRHRRLLHLANGAELTFGPPIKTLE